MRTESRITRCNISPTPASPAARARTISWLLILTASLGGCAIDEGSTTTCDLVESFATARTRVESTKIDFGTVGAGAHLLSGWSGDESTPGPAGRTFVWSEGETSVLRFFLADVRDLRLILSCSPFVFEDSPRQGFTVAVNGEVFSDIELDAGFRDYALALPASLLTSGDNTLSFRYRYVATPADVSPSPDTRRLAVAWDFILFNAKPTIRRLEPRTDLGRRALMIPAGAQIDYAFDLAGKSAFHLDAIDIAGAPETRLLLFLQVEGEPERALATLDSSSQDRVIPLPKAPARLVRLSLRVASPDARPGVVTLTAPRIRTVARPQNERLIGKHPIRSSLPRRPHILIYVVDTLRADSLGCYEASKHTSPNVDAFARQAILFDNAIAQSPWTKPSVASIFTGLWPGLHAVHKAEDRLSAAAFTMAEVLGAAGYRTAAFIANASVNEASGFAQGFDEFIVPDSPRLSDEINQRFFSWLEGHDLEVPFFAYLHTIDPHYPYDPPAAFREKLAPTIEVRDLGGTETLRHLLAQMDAAGAGAPELAADLRTLYEAEIAFNDSQFGRLLRGLRRRGLYEGALILFVSDHGEEFYERGSIGHGQSLHSEVLNVPMILKLPNQSQGWRVSQPVQHIDILPTLLDVLGLAPPVELAGESLLRIGKTPERSLATDDRKIFSHLDYEPRRGLSVVYRDWKLIYPLTRQLASGPQLFHRRRDPGETENVIAERPVVAEYLASQARSKVARRRHALEAERLVLDKETRQALRALGYLQ